MLVECCLLVAAQIAVAVAIKTPLELLVAPLFHFGANFTPLFLAELAVAVGIKLLEHLLAIGSLWARSASGRSRSAPSLEAASTTRRGPVAWWTIAIGPIARTVKTATMRSAMSLFAMLPCMMALTVITFAMMSFTVRALAMFALGAGSTVAPRTRSSSAMRRMGLAAFLFAELAVTVGIKLLDHCGTKLLHRLAHF